MKKLTLAIFIALVAAIAVAQGPPAGKGGPGGPGGGRGRGMDPKQQVEMMKKELNLTAAQSKKIEALVTANQAERKKLMAAPGDRKAKQPQMKKLRDGMMDNLKKVLTKDQMAKWQKHMEEMRAKFGGGRGMGGPGGKGGPPKGGAAKN